MLEGYVRIKSKRVCHRTLYNKIGEVFGYYERYSERYHTDIIKYGVSLNGKDYEFYEYELEPVNDYFEAVEVCPHCMGENIYPMWETEISGFVAICKHCKEEILLCDECKHTILEDGEVHNCDWCKTDTGGKCHRGITINKTK